MTIIDFIRHAEPDIAVHDDQLRPLSAVGQQQAIEIGYQLRNEHYSAIYSSPMARSVATVSPLAKQLRMPIQTNALLVERRMPGWLPDFDGYTKRQWREFDYAEGDGESLHQAQQRYLRFITTIPEDTHIAVGVHGTALSTLIETVRPGCGFEFWKQLKFGEVVRISSDSTRMSYIDSFKLS